MLHFRTVHPDYHLIWVRKMYHTSSVVPQIWRLAEVDRRVYSFIGSFSILLKDRLSVG